MWKFILVSLKVTCQHPRFLWDWEALSANKLGDIAQFGDLVWNWGCGEAKQRLLGRKVTLGSEGRPGRWEAGERKGEQYSRLLPFHVALWHPSVQPRTKQLLPDLLHSLRARQFWYSRCYLLDKYGISVLWQYVLNLRAYFHRAVSVCICNIRLMLQDVQIQESLFYPQWFQGQGCWQSRRHILSSKPSLLPTTLPRVHLRLVSGEIPSLKELLSHCPGKWWDHRPWRYLKDMEMWLLGCGSMEDLAVLC